MKDVTRRGAKTARFLEIYRHSGSGSESAKVVGIDCAAHYKCIKRDPEYAAAFADVRREAVTALEDEAVRRAVEGTGKPVCYLDIEFHGVRLPKVLGNFCDQWPSTVIDGGEGVSVILTQRAGVGRWHKHPIQGPAEAGGAGEIMLRLTLAGWFYKLTCSGVGKWKAWLT